MEIPYQISNISDLREPLPDPDVTIRWLQPDDWEAFREHLNDQHPNRTFTREQWQEWTNQGVSYCGLFRDGKMLARAAVERYSETHWETGDVRTCRKVRSKGYAKQVSYFVTQYILENQRIATGHTEEDNIAMQHVFISLGFKSV